MKENCRPEVQHLVSRNQLSMVVAVSMSKLTDNGQTQALHIMHPTQFSVPESRMFCLRIYATENQYDMVGQLKKSLQKG